MLTLGGDFYLFGKALRTEHGGEFGSQDFDSDLALVLEVVGDVGGGNRLRPGGARSCSGRRGLSRGGRRSRASG